MALTKIALRPTWLKRWAQKSFAQDFTFLIVQDPSSPSSVSELNLMACLKTQTTFSGFSSLSHFNANGKVKANPRRQTLNPGLLLLCVFKKWLLPAIPSITCTSSLPPVLQHAFLTASKISFVCKKCFILKLCQLRSWKSAPQWAFASIIRYNSCTLP